MSLNLHGLYLMALNFTGIIGIYYSQNNYSQLKLVYQQKKEN